MSYPRTPNQKWNASNLNQGYYGDYQPFSFVDGPGVRHSLYVSGCPFSCPGCYNQSLQSFRAGQPFTQEIHNRIIADLGHPSVQGLSLLGGEPMLATNILLPLVKDVRKTYAHTKDIWVWTGYTYQTISGQDKLELLSLCDVLVDGPYIKEQHNSNLPFRGSDNQRLIDIKQGLSEKNITPLKLP